MLREARLTAGFASHARVVEKIGFSQPTLSRIERGRKIPSESELCTLLTFYCPVNRAEIEDLAVRAREDTPGLDPDFQTLREREKVADRVRKFTSERIPTALQCGRYILKQYELAGIPYDLNEVVYDHESLAADLKREQGPLFEVVASLSSFLRMPGGDLGVVGEQAIHILGLLDTAPRLSLRVLMYEANVPYIDTDFTIVTGGGQPDMVYAQSGQDGFTIAGKTKIQERERYWDVVQTAALSVEESRVVLQKLAEREPVPLAGWFSIAK
ncbi:Scr1 family TA system antitoxin-like transcriptional regulator [Actinophytocola glycyrrhizae]|uniref:Scr1 family TA system antitoxin-like transcriptional regulator n=1 Tax=Actinophytocola glycyrrhizae TaxID=2044873 RepID=A0ABV9S8K3_9PSEU